MMIPRSVLALVAVPGASKMIGLRVSDRERTQAGDPLPSELLFGREGRLPYSHC